VVFFTGTGSEGHLSWKAVSTCTTLPCQPITHLVLAPQVQGCTHLRAGVDNVAQAQPTEGGVQEVQGLRRSIGIAAFAVIEGCPEAGAHAQLEVPELAREPQHKQRCGGPASCTCCCLCERNQKVLPTHPAGSMFSSWSVCE
jgi:hypothetical protein